MGIINEVIDITHHSKRTQAGNLERAGVIKASKADTSGVACSSEVPQNITIERAIDYFKQNAEGEYKNLYTATAKWLEQFNTFSRTSVKKATDNDIATVDVSEVSDNE